MFYFDTREQKEQYSDIQLKKYLEQHPEIAKVACIKREALRIGDFYGNRNLIEAKWGKDAWSSAFSDKRHMLDQLRRMREFQIAEALNGNIIETYLICADTDTYRMDMKTEAILISWCQDWHVKYHHYFSQEAAMAKIMDLMRTPPSLKDQDLEIPLKFKAISENPLINALAASIDGLTPRMAAAVVRDASSFRELVQLAPAEIGDRLSMISQNNESMLKYRIYHMLTGIETEEYKKLKHQSELAKIRRKKKKEEKMYEEFDFNFEDLDLD